MSVSKWKRVRDVLGKERIESDDDCIYWYREVYGIDEAVEICFGAE